MEHIAIEKIWQKDTRTLGIVWTDGKESQYDVVELRRKCPCASCIDEWTKKPILRPDDVPESIRPVKIDSVGRYGLNIQFNDGHNTGIYSFQALRDS
jgi:DUF971 family protein